MENKKKSEWIWLTEKKPTDTDIKASGNRFLIDDGTLVREASFDRSLKQFRFRDNDNLLSKFMEKGMRWRPLILDREEPDLEKPAPVIKLALTVQDRRFQFPIKELMEILLPNYKPDDVREIRLEIEEKDCGVLRAEIDNKEKDYPGIYLTATDKNGRQFELAQAELPNEDNPDKAVARLYAGDLDYEYDGPIAMVKHKMNLDSAELERRKEAAKHAVIGHHKIVYVDTDTAQYRVWRETGAAPEHAEDE